MKKNHHLMVITLLTFLISSNSLAAPIDNSTTVIKSLPLLHLWRNVPSVQKSCFPLWIYATASALFFTTAYLIQRNIKTEEKWTKAGLASAALAGTGLLQLNTFINTLADCLNQAAFKPPEFTIEKEN